MARLRRLVEGDADRLAAHIAQIDAELAGAPVDRRRAAVELDRQGIEEVPVRYLEAEAPEARAKDGGQAMRPLGNDAEPLRAVVDRGESSHHGKQDLGRAARTEERRVGKQWGRECG